MKTLLVSTPHSILDVITNSSTELFVCDTDKTVEMVKEILAADPNVYGYEEPWVFELKRYREWKRKYREAQEKSGQYVKETGVIDPDYQNMWEDKFHNILGWFYDTEDPEDIEYLRKHYIDYGDMSGNCWTSDSSPFNDRIRNAQKKAVDEFLKTKEDGVGKIESEWGVSVDALRAEIQKIYDETQGLEIKPDWWTNPLKYYYNNQPISDLDGKIMIVGESDNSIPYDHFDWIENTFNATRHHLG